MKVVGKRKPGPGNLQDAAPFLKLVIKLFGNNPFLPKGVYRFRSHKEAQEQLTQSGAKTKT